jgi:arylsulfatase
MDRGIGRIVQTLEESGQLDNTLVMYFQDNGGCAEGFGRDERIGPLERPDAPTLPPMDANEVQTEMVPPQSRDGYALRRGEGVIPGPPETQIGYGRNWANVSNTPFREYKHWVHEGGIATPLIAHWPRGIEGTNGWFRTPAHLIDLMATCLDLAGAEYPTHFRGHEIIPLEGISLRPAFEGGELVRGKPIFWEHEGNRAVRDGKWKLVAKGVNGKWELYDMETDRTEMRDLAAQQPELVIRMAKQYGQWAEERGVVPFGSWNDGRKRAGQGGADKDSFELRAGEVLPTAGTSSRAR